MCDVVVPAIAFFAGFISCSAIDRPIIRDTFRDGFRLGVTLAHAADSVTEGVGQ